jgi:transcriptional regulator with XRE-family HTH domain
MNLGYAIKLCRTEKNIKQNELAKLSKISVAYLSLLEQGKRDPNFSTLECIARALEVPLSIIMFLAADKQNELNDLSEELREKISYTSLKLIRESKRERTTISQ